MAQLYQEQDRSKDQKPAEDKALWGRSSAGRAPALQAGGQEFDSPRLHQHRPKAGNLFLENYTEEERKKDFTKEEIILRTEGNSNKAKKSRWKKRRKSRYKGRTVDALAIPAEEGRDKLRKAAERCK